MDVSEVTVKYEDLCTKQVHYVALKIRVDIFKEKPSITYQGKGAFNTQIYQQNQDGHSYLHHICRSLFGSFVDSESREVSREVVLVWED